MTRRQIDAARERRLWIRDVIMPMVTTVGMVIIAVPEAKEFVVTKAQNLKQKIQDRFKK